MITDSLEPTQKVAIMLLSLDQGLAAEVLGRMPREMVERVTLAIANAGNVTREQQESVLNQFKSEFVSRPLMQPGGATTARDLLERTLDQDELEPVQERFEEQVQAGPFAFLHLRDADDVRMLIEVEHPQTIAVITAQLPPGLSAKVLAGFDPVRQAEILGRLAEIGPTDTETLEEIATILQNRIGKMPRRIGGVHRAADVLRQSDRSTSNSLIKLMNRKHAESAQSIRQSLFSFKDLAVLDDPTLTVVVQETIHFPWAIALKGCSEKLCQRICRSLPTKAGKELSRKWNSTGPLRLSEISGVQHQITEAILALEEDGKIELPAQESKRSLLEENKRKAV